MRERKRKIQSVVAALMVIFLFLGESLQVEAAKYSTADVMVVMDTRAGATIYTDADTSSTLVATVGSGIAVQVTGITTNSWFRVSIDGVTLYMPANALTSTSYDSVGTGYLPMGSTAEYTVRVNNLQEAISAVDMMIAMRVRTLRVTCTPKVRAAVYGPAWNQLCRYLDQSLGIYNTADMHGISCQVVNNGEFVMRVNYGMVEKEAAVETAVAEIYRKYNTGTTYDKVLAVHDYLCNTVVYQETGEDSHSAYGALINKAAVCEGYALAFQRIMDTMGIPCFVASGNDHAWNVVQVDGQWYHIDVTNADQDWGIGRKYFLISGSSMGYTTWGNDMNVVTMATSNYVVQ